MSLKQNILEEFDERFIGMAEDVSLIKQGLILSSEPQYHISDVIEFIESKLSLIEQEVRKCVPDRDIPLGYKMCRQDVLDNLDELFNSLDK